MRPTSVNCLLYALFAASAVSLLGSTLAADDPPPMREVKVSVVAILASEQDNKIDPRLEAIAKEIQKHHPQLKGFRMGKMTDKKVPVRGGSESFELVADQKADITVLKTADRNDKVQLKITPPTLGEITYTTTCGKFFPIMTRYQTSNNESLIVAVRVQPCKDGKK